MSQRLDIQKAANFFYEFDALKLLSLAKSFKTEFEQIQFYEMVKMEHKIAVSFCEAHINAIKNCKKFLLNFDFDDLQHYPEEQKNIENIIKTHFTKPNSWDKYFFTEKDFLLFASILSNFFSGLPYDQKNKNKVENHQIRLILQNYS